MRDQIILAMSCAVTLAALSLLAFFSPKVRNHKHANKYLVILLVLVIIAAIILLYAQYAMKA